MHYWSLAFVVIACAAVIMGLTDWSGVTSLAAWGLFLASAVLALLSLLLGGKPETAELPGVRRDSRRKFGA